MTEREPKSKHMIITVETKTGKTVKIVDENGNHATEVDPKEIEEIYKSKDGFKFVSTILHAHSSPGCVYYFIGGKYFKFCW